MKRRIHKSAGRRTVTLERVRKIIPRASVSTSELERVKAALAKERFEVKALRARLAAVRASNESEAAELLSRLIDLIVAEAKRSKLTPAEATARVLRTQEGRDLWNRHARLSGSKVMPGSLASRAAERLK